MTTNNMTNTSFPLPKSEGGTGVTSQKSIIQIVSSVIPLQTFATAIPFDNTLPQNTEGSQIGTVTITPTNSANILEVYAECAFVNGTANGQVGIMSLFRDSGADAVAAVFTINARAAVGRQWLQIMYRVVAGSTSSTTFNLRMGGNSALTWYTNGTTSGGALWTGIDETSIYVTEIEA